MKYEGIDKRVANMKPEDQRVLNRVVGKIAQAHGLSRKSIGAIVLHDSNGTEVIVKLQGRGVFDIDNLVPMPEMPLTSAAIGLGRSRQRVFES